MNYTKTIREYCCQNKGAIFDLKRLGEEYFHMIPYKTLHKILKRLEDEGLLKEISAGIFYIKDGDVENIDSAITKTYIMNGMGVIVGPAMYNETGISDIESEYVDILSCRASGKTKNIGKYRIKQCDLFFSEHVSKIVRALDVIQNAPDGDAVAKSLIITEGVLEYRDYTFVHIVKAIHYSYSTIVTFDEYLKRNGINSDCIEIYTTQENL